MVAHEMSETVMRIDMNITRVSDSEGENKGRGETRNRVKRLAEQEDGWHEPRNRWLGVECQKAACSCVE